MDIKETLLQFCSGKKIVIVGNSSSLLQKENGTIIDEHEVVVRMNHGYPRKATLPYTGQKTDIWVCAFNNLIQQIREYQIFSPKFAIRLNNETHIHPRMKDVFLRWDMKNWEQIKRTTGIKKYPSTGLITIYFFTQFLKLEEISITGFDFFATNNFYRNTKRRNAMAKAWHSPGLEKKIIMDLINEKKIMML